VDKIIEFFAIIGLWTIFITPLTLIIGIINAIRKPEKAMQYTILAIISAYLIIMPLMYGVLRS